LEKIEFRFNEFNKLINICKKLRDYKYSTSSIRTYEAARLYNKALLHAISFTVLWPKTTESFEDLDIGTLASIARNIIEAHNVFHYICEPKITKEEIEFRIYLMNLHYCHDTVDILDKLGFADSHDIKYAFKISETIAKEILEDNSFFLSLNKNRRDFLLQGKKAYCESVIKVKKTPIDNTLESGLYNLFSNSIHSYLLGIVNNIELSTDNHVIGENVLFLVLETMILYFSSITKSYLSLRTRMATCIPEEEKEFIKSFSDDYLKKWIYERKIASNKRIFVL
jgi:hypothetical protein